MRTIEKRLKAIEEARGKNRRPLIVWDDHRGSADAEKARLEASGEADRHQIIFVGWENNETAAMFADRRLDSYIDPEASAKDA